MQRNFVQEKKKTTKVIRFWGKVFWNRHIWIMGSNCNQNGSIKILNMTYGKIIVFWGDFLKNNSWLPKNKSATHAKEFCAREKENDQSH